MARCGIIGRMLGRIVIVGAGPCGLACARELERLGHPNWLVLERSASPGGLAASVRDGAGFTWDLGGHVVFSHYGEFDALLDEVMDDDVCAHDRSSYVRFGDRWVPYPFQNNLRHLPPEVADECLWGLERAPGGDPSMDFGTWMRAVFGDGITRHFMSPYNLKVWATRSAEMSAGWIAERVAVVDYARVAANVRDGRDDLAWGPNNTFVFPARGGTGEIYRRLAGRLGERVRYRSEVVELDPAAQRLRTAAGERIDYDALVSTMPLDRLVRAVRGAPAPVRRAAGALRHNGVYMVGVGYEAPLRDTKSWMYFPDPRVPFYRATNFAKYSPANVPGEDTGRYCAYMTETAYSDQLPVDRVGLELRVEAALRSAGVIGGRPAVASIHVEDIPYAYPVPTVGRDAALAAIQPWLMERSIYSRGRFGAWRYEAGNMDHAVKMGIDVARRLVGDGAEELWQLS
jgi:UDP-galactopyranose mutase